MVALPGFTEVRLCEKILYLNNHKAVGGRLTRAGVYIHIQLIHDAAQQTPTGHCKAIIFQLKNFLYISNNNFFLLLKIVSITSKNIRKRKMYK